MTDASTGYQHEVYARSLAEFGEPVHLRGCDGWILRRGIPGSAFVDGMGCYPVFSCRDWARLPEDVAGLSEESGIVSLSIVADPFGERDTDTLRRAFPDRMVAFKEHHVVDLSVPYPDRVSRHHQRNVRKAAKSIEVESCASPEDHLGTWSSLYARLVRRHSISGISTFSSDSFATQFRVPGLRLFRAEAADETLGMIMWLTSGGVAYYHLAAYTDLGYDLRASYGLFRASMQAFEDDPTIAWMSLGGGAGLTAGKADGLTRFKEGWATGTRTAYFCGRVLAPDAYRTLSREKRVPETGVFPAYRHGEFA